VLGGGRGQRRKMRACFGLAPEKGRMMMGHQEDAKMLNQGFG
jgi:hypothetical protein